MSDEYDFAIVGGALLQPAGETSPLDHPPAPEPEGAVPAKTDAVPVPAENDAAPSTPPSDAEQLPPEKAKKLTKKRFEKELEELRESWQVFEKAVAASGTKLVVLVEGRDAGRERGVVSRIVEFADPRVCRVAMVEAPGARERSQWFLQPYVAHLPAAGEIALFDGGWYARAALDRATGTFSQEEYIDVLRACADFERVLVRSGVVVLKYWLSVEGDRGELLEQLTNLAKRWDVSSKELGDLDYATMHEEIFASTDVEEAPWTVVSHSDKREVRLQFIRMLAGSMAGTAPPREAGLTDEASDPPPPAEDPAAGEE